MKEIKWGSAVTYEELDKLDVKEISDNVLDGILIALYRQVVDGLLGAMVELEDDKYDKAKEEADNVKAPLVTLIRFEDERQRRIVERYVQVGKLAKKDDGGKDWN